MAGKVRNKIKKMFKARSITFVMFWLSFITIAFVLLIGFLIIGIIAPRVYSSSVMSEIKDNLVATIQYYDIDLKELYLNPVSEIKVEVVEPFENKRGYYSQGSHTFSQYLIEDADDEKIIQTINISNLLTSLTLSHGAIIEIADSDGTVIYHTPNWYEENISSLRFHKNIPDFIQKNPLLSTLIVDNEWITRSTPLQLGEPYLLTVKLDLRAFNQNLTIFNRLFLYMIAVGGLFALLSSIVLSFIVTRPLKELKKIAVSMENMNFSIRYEKGREDEIGQLGSTLNHMMDRLGTTISKLKAELQKEKRTDKLRREFVAQVSHELKTPIAIVSNYTEALLDGVADTKDEQDSYLNTIEDECRKMGHIINDLLDLSQMEAGTFKITKSQFNFKHLLDDLIGKYDHMTKGEYKLKTEIKMETAIMDGDELRIEQAISNLLSNAVKHTPHKGSIILSAAIENNMAHVKIENDGPPIDETLLPHIWDSFAKGADEKGAGLGLSIAKNIIELHGGEYYVRNNEKSVVFGIRLPL